MHQLFLTALSLYFSSQSIHAQKVVDGPYVRCMGNAISVRMQKGQKGSTFMGPYVVNMSRSEDGNKFDVNYVDSSNGEVVSRSSVESTGETAGGWFAIPGADLLVCDFRCIYEGGYEALCWPDYVKPILEQKSVECTMSKENFDPVKISMTEPGAKTFYDIPGRTSKLLTIWSRDNHTVTLREEGNSHKLIAESIVTSRGPVTKIESAWNGLKFSCEPGF